MLVALLLWAVVGPFVEGVLDEVAPDIYCDTIECGLRNADLDELP